MNQLTQLAAIFLLGSSLQSATQVDIHGPTGSGSFGHSVTVLPNGNFVVVDFAFNQADPVVEGVGAVYLYSPEGEVISTLRGSSAGDGVGSGGITVLMDGNFVVKSPHWNHGPVARAGAATWGNAVHGFIGGPNAVVSSANSLVGSSPIDSVGAFVVPLDENRYAVVSKEWDNGGAVNAGAVTFNMNAAFSFGVVSAMNSIVGTTSEDQVGSGGVTSLSQGNCVVSSPLWDNGAVVNVGAATWIDLNSNGNGTGLVSPANSMIGQTVNDLVSSGGITSLPTGHFLVVSPLWDDPVNTVVDAGAVTWINGNFGHNHFVNQHNSLVGSQTNDQVGSAGVTVLSNGHYVVGSPLWNLGNHTNSGAATWGNGNSGIKGTISSGNSLLGSSHQDQVGNAVTALTNGNYVVSSPDFDQPTAPDSGAVTWGDGRFGISGFINPSNSLLGTTAEDRVGRYVTALTNGNYVINSPNWDRDQVADVGASTWADGRWMITGFVSLANSLIGSKSGDFVGSQKAATLTNGNYVVASPAWDHGSTPDVGAVTWGNGMKGIKGPVSTTNSLFGTKDNDRVGERDVTPLVNGHYVVASPNWDHRALVNVGAVTWGNGTHGIKGRVSLSNSLIGSFPDQRAGGEGITPLTQGNYVVRSPVWNHISPTPGGSVTWGDGTKGISGPITEDNSLVDPSNELYVGSNPVKALSNGHFVVESSNLFSPQNAALWAVTLGDGHSGMLRQIDSSNTVKHYYTLGRGRQFPIYDYDPDRNRLIVGRRTSNVVTLIQGQLMRSLAKTSEPSPDLGNIKYSRPGTAAVNPAGNTLASFSLSGAGTAGKNQGLFFISPTGGAALVMQSGTPLSALGSGLPSNAVATALHGPLFNQDNLGLFQATVKGTGITSNNNRLLLLDNGIDMGISLLHRSGTPIPTLADATVLSFTEVLQSHDQDLVTLRYKLKPGGDVHAANDEGLLFLDHNGAVSPHTAAREGQPAFGGGGSFGAFNGRAAAALGETVHFTAHFKPDIGKAMPALFSTTADGVTTARITQTGATAPDSDSATFSAFVALSHQGNDALVKATLKGGPVSRNEGLYRLPANVLLTRKGDDIGGGLNIARILRFWPAGLDQVILHMQVSGTGVKVSNNQVLALRQSDGAYLILLRTGFPAPGTGPAAVKAISAVDVNPVTGLYAVLGTLNGAPASSNQALWTGDPTLGNDTPALQILRLPQLTLRKGNLYSTDATPIGRIRSITLKPALDATGAGGRGLAQVLGASGDLAIFITDDRKLVELVLLDR